MHWYEIRDLLLERSVDDSVIDQVLSHVVGVSSTLMDGELDPVFADIYARYGNALADRWALRPIEVPSLKM